MSKIRFSEDLFPVVSKLSQFKNKELGELFDISQAPLVHQQAMSTFFKRHMARFDIMPEYVSTPILDIIDADEKNVTTLAKLRSGDHEGEGIMMYGKSAQIIYSIKNNTHRAEIIAPNMRVVPDKNYFIIHLVGNALLGYELGGFSKSEDGKGLFYAMDCWSAPICRKGNYKHADWYSLVDALILFKQVAEVETKVLPPKEGMKWISCKYSNPNKKAVRIIDSTYFTTLIKTGSFKVRGHFRFQACGEGMKDRKVIWVNDFEKSGYTREAKKLKEEV